MREQISPVTEDDIEASKEARYNLASIGANCAAHVLGLEPNLPTNCPISSGMEVICETKCPVYLDALNELADLDPGCRQPSVE